MIETDHNQLRRALLAKPFDIVIDFVMYLGVEAQTVIELFKDNVDHYIVLSTGQVYLVLEGEIDSFAKATTMDG